MLHYVQGRNTEDIDLIISVSSLQALPEIALTSQENNFARGTFATLQIDFLLTRNPFFAMVQRRYATIKPFRERDIPCATVEGLLLLKLYALPSLYRQGNFARVGLYENDIATLMHDYRPDLGPLFEELEPYLSASDIATLRDIVADIQHPGAACGDSDLPKHDHLYAWRHTDRRRRPSVSGGVAQCRSRHLGAHGPSHLSPVLPRPQF